MSNCGTVDAGSDATVSSGSARPQAVVFVGDAAAADTTAADARMTIGVASQGRTIGSVSMFADNAQTSTPDTGRSASITSIDAIGTGQAVDGAFTLKNRTTTGFRTGVTTPAGIFGYLALAADDAEVLQVTLPGGVTTFTKQFSFNPDMLLVLSRQGALGTGTQGFAILGMCDGSLNQAALTIGSRHQAPPTETFRRHDTTHCYVAVQASTGNVTQSVKVTGISNGLVTFSEDVSDGGARDLILLGLKLPGAKVYPDETFRGTAGDDELSGAGFTPTAAIGFATGTTTVNSSVASLVAGVGFSDGTNHVCQAVADEAQQDPTDADHRLDSDAFLVTLDHARAVTSEGTIAFGTDGATISWSTAQSQHGAVALIREPQTVSPLTGGRGLTQ